MIIALIILAIVLFLVAAYYFGWFGIMAVIVDIVSDLLVSCLMFFHHD